MNWLESENLFDILMKQRTGTKVMFAREMGIKPQNVRNIKNPTCTTLWEMVRVLHLSEEELYALVRHFATKGD